MNGDNEKETHSIGSRLIGIVFSIEGFIMMACGFLRQTGADL